MNRTQTLNRLILTAVDNGYEDLIRTIAPFSDDVRYPEWLIESGYYKSIMISPAFIEALFQFFQTKNIVDEKATVKGLLREVITAQDPVAFLGNMLEQAEVSENDFEKIIESHKFSLEQKLGTTVELVLADDPDLKQPAIGKIATFTLGSFIHIEKMSGDDKTKLFKAVVEGLDKLEADVISMLAKEGVKTAQAAEKEKKEK